MKKAVLTVFAIILLFSPISQGLPAHATTNQVDAVKILSDLTTSEREALHVLQTSEQTGLHLDPSIDLSQNQHVDVIVQFNELPAASAVTLSKAEGKSLTLSEAKKKVDTAHANFKKDVEAIRNIAKSKSLHLVVNHEFKHAFNGVSMTLPADQVESLLESKEVKTIWSDKKVQVITPIVNDEKKEQLVVSPAVDVQALHEEGFTGEGVKVAVIDTGIDYHHPDLKDAYKGGFDFVDNDEDPMETTYEDWKQSGRAEVMSGNTYYTAHGTHVAGIIAGQGKNESEYAVTGISPDVELYGYRVLGPYGTGMGSHIIAAVDRSVQDGMDIINLSLGASINDPFYPTSIAVNNAVLAGVTSVVAAGNSGSEMRTLGSPGTASLGLTVGANNTSITVPTFDGVVGDSQVDLRAMALNIMAPIQNLEGETLSIIDVGLGQPADYTGKQVEGKAVLISRGVTSFDQKITLAKNKGAQAILIYNNMEEQGHIPHYLGETVTYIPTFSLTKVDGEMLKGRLANEELSITFNNLDEHSMDGGNLTDFSSRGPSRLHYEIKPEVTAPGEQILSTIPAYMNGKDHLNNYDIAYKRYSGTSMASPYAAGLAALLLDKNSEYTPEQIKTILMNTADPLNKQYSVFEAGSGQVNPLKALNNEVEMMVDNPAVTFMNGEKVEVRSKSGALNFGPVLLEGENRSVERAVSIANNGNRPKTFEVTSEFQVGIRGSNDAAENGVALQMAKVVTVPMKQSRVTNMGISVPAHAQPGTYEGFITLTNKKDTSEAYRIPFAVVVVEKGMHYMKTNPKAITKNFEFYHPFVPSATGVSFSIKSAMETLDFILLDGKTGEELGFLGQMNARGIYEDTDYYVGGVFDGRYYPFTGNPENPIASEWVNVKRGPGHYKVKLISTDMEGITYELVDHTFIDFTGPSFQTETEEGFIEYQKGMTSYTIKGSLIDQTYESYKALGVDIDQSQNFIMEKYNSQIYSSGFYVNADGSFEYNMPINPSLKSANVELYGYNSAGVGGDYKFYTLVEEGTPYLYGSLDNKYVKGGDTVKMTLTANNVSEAKKWNALFNFNKNSIEVLDAKVLIEDSTVKISTSSVNSSTDRLGVEVEVGNGSMSGDEAIAEITLKVKDDTYGLYAHFSNSQASYLNAEGQSITMPSSYAPLRITPIYSKISGSINPPKALQREGRPGWRPGLNASNIGAEVYVLDHKGTHHDATIRTTSQLYVEKLPVTLEEMQLVAKLPGHFTYTRSFNVGFPDDQGNVIAQWNSELNVVEMTPGDVNDDGVIDIYDALLIEEHWGTNYRSADINFDQSVNGTDMQYVVDNYLLVNKTAVNPPEPTDVHNGRTLEDILASLNVN
ncbi:subtilisin family serine protease [Bacillus tianshenii]|uniref:Subtilisin family serine protease n=2 Tax=Sutcliffiella tianshenii TaxID=1463404 RepID=A0ABS2NYB1_9BACI|nr:subtilisin family serine protease [Bacillus tianshenii]